MTRLVTALLALAAAAPAAQDPAAFFRYRRSVPAPPAGQVCATVDAPVYAHAASSLKDLRLLGRSSAGTYEVPYVLTLSEAQPVVGDSARVLNLGHRGDRIVFDLEMPPRTYSDVDLVLDGKDFLATARVSGSGSGARAPVELGEFTLFDLTSQHLARSTTLHLPESTFHLLHVELRVHGAGGSGTRFVQIRGATVPASREAQTLYTVAIETSALEQRGRDTVAHFLLPARVPIEQVRFDLQPGFTTNFSREVSIEARTRGAAPDELERISGRIERVRLERDGITVESKDLTVSATVGANLQSDAEITVLIHNGDDPPLPIASVALAMRKRSLCFQARGSAPTLLYGDPGLDAPVYDYARTFSPADRMITVTLGPEEHNPAWQARPDRRVFTDRHPHVVYFALLATVCVLALVAFRSGKVHQRR